MKSFKNKVIICGAGIAGIATAYYLLRKEPDVDVVLIDKHQPLSFTTSKSGENYRDYWPQTSMRNLVSDSIEMMHQLSMQFGNDAIHLIDNGYSFVSHDKNNPIFGVNQKEGNETFYQEIKDTKYIRNTFPYLVSGIEKVLHVHNAGRIDVYAMGSLMLSEAQKMGLQVVKGEVVTMQKYSTYVEVELDNGDNIRAAKLVIAAGPFINNLARMLDLEFPVVNTVQHKFILQDPKQIIPRDMPFIIYADKQYLDWSEEERDFFKQDDNLQWLLEEFPGGLHVRPDGTGIKMGWAFQTEEVDPGWEIPKMELFAQVVLKGASTFIPAFKLYEDDIPVPIINYGGHYTRTKENWPLIGPCELDNVFIVGALAGYGTMSACAAGSLCSQYILEEKNLPDYAPYFHPLRYTNNKILKEMEDLASDGQL